MRRDIRGKLIELARSKDTMNYSKLNDALKLEFNFNKRGNSEFYEWLSVISTVEYYKLRPLLSIVIINKATDKPGEKLIELYKNLRKKVSDHPDYLIKGYKTNDELFEELKDRCFTFWRNTDNYLRFKDDV